MENNIDIYPNGKPSSTDFCTPIVVPDILKDCLLILAHDKQGHNGFRRTYALLKKIDTTGKAHRNQYTNTVQTAKYVQSTTSQLSS